MSKNNPVTRRILELTQERDAARLQAEHYRNQMEHEEKASDALSEAVQELRKQLDDVRRQRDDARREANMASENLEVERRRVSRLMGWVDAKMDQPPRIDLAELPF